MKLSHLWFVLAAAGVVTQVVLFNSHKSPFVLIVGVILCSFTAIGLIRTTACGEDQKKFQDETIASFIGCALLGTFFNVWALSGFGFGNFISIAISVGFFCWIALALNKGSRDSLGYLGNAFKELFHINLGGDMEGCFAGLLGKLLGLFLAIAFGVVFMFISYVSSTLVLLIADVENKRGLLDSLKIKNTTQGSEDGAASAEQVEEKKDNGDWL